MKNNDSSKSSSLSPNIKSNQNNKINTSSQKNQNNSDIKISNVSNTTSLKQKALKIILENSHLITSQKTIEKMLRYR